MLGLSRCISGGGSNATSTPFYNVSILLHSLFLFYIGDNVGFKYGVGYSHSLACFPFVSLHLKKNQKYFCVDCVTT